MSKKILLGAIVLIIGAVLAWNMLSSQPSSPSEAQKTPLPISEDENPRIVSTKPDPLEGSIVSAYEPLEITFNKPIQNSGEFKIRIEPKVEFKKELSQDRKTARIIFEKPLELGTTYTLFIQPDTKFDGTNDWGEEKIIHINTVKFRGI